MGLVWWIGWIGFLDFDYSFFLRTWLVFGACWWVGFVAVEVNLVWRWVALGVKRW